MFSIVIVNYNLTDNIIECVKSILSNISENEYECIIVDNNSSQEEKDLLYNALCTYPEVKIYFLESNNGFGFGNNFGINKSSGDILFLLNPDTLITRDIFTDAKNIMDRFPDFGVIGPKIYNEYKIQEKSVGIFPNLFLEFLNIFSLSRFIEKKYFERKVQKTTKDFIEVDWITGSAMFIRRSVFDRVGGFDTNYFMYSEEIDLCKRIKAMGGKIIYYPSIELIHKGSVGSKKNYYFFTKTSYESKYYYIKKHFIGIEKLLILLFLKIQIIIQFLIWIILYPINANKSSGKLKALSKLILSSKISESLN